MHDLALKVHSIMIRFEMLDQFESLMADNCDFLDVSLSTDDVIQTMAWTMSRIIVQLDGWTSDDNIKTVLLACSLFCALALVLKLLTLSLWSLQLVISVMTAG